MTAARVRALMSTCGAYGMLLTGDYPAASID